MLWESEKDKWNTWTCCYSAAVVWKWAEEIRWAPCSSPLTYWKQSYQTSLLLFISTPVLTDQSCYSWRQITGAWVLSRLWRTEMSSRGEREMRRTCFLTCFSGDCCCAATTTSSTTCQSDVSGSARAQLWHYLQIVNKEKYLASQYDS